MDALTDSSDTKDGPKEHTQGNLLHPRFKLWPRKRHQAILWFLASLWSSGQSFWLQIQRSRVRFPALSDFSE